MTSTAIATADRTPVEDVRIELLERGGISPEDLRSVKGAYSGLGGLWGNALYDIFFAYETSRRS